MFMIVAFDAFPVLYAVFLSLFKLRYFDLSRASFVGLGNYLSMWGDRYFRADFFHSVVFTLCSVAITFVVGLALALLFGRLGKVGLLLLSIVLIPWTISRVVGSLLWKWVFLEEGLLAYFLSLLRLPSISLLSQPRTAMAALIFNAVWRTLGYATIFLYAGLKNIPEDIYKAAQVDGASGWYQLFHITLPLLKQVTLVVLSILTLSYFNEVTLPMTLTGGNPYRSTETLSLLLYRKGFSEFHTGYANALAVTMYLFNLFMVLLYIRILRIREIY